MSVKIVMTWDITPDHEQEYFEFVISEFIPGVQRLGLQPVEAWVTLFGDYPQIQVGILANSVSVAQRVLQSSGWKKLYEKLSGFIVNYKFKVIQVRGGFQF